MLESRSGAPIGPHKIVRKSPGWPSTVIGRRPAISNGVRRRGVLVMSGVGVGKLAGVRLAAPVLTPHVGFPFAMLPHVDR
jgi:hypothetical protein